MASTSETGHAKNVANFKAIITVVKSFGAQYQPSSKNLQVEVLELQAESAEKTLNKLKEAETLNKQANATLQMHFKSLNTFSSRLMGLLISSEPKASSIEEARSIQKRITGGNTKKKKEEVVAKSSNDAKIKRSQSRQSYDSRLDDFAKLITVLQNIPEYNPNEEELKITTLQNMVQIMKQAIEDNDSRDLMRNQAMNERNVVLYSADTGLTDTVFKIKAYVKAKFGGIKSVQYKSISKIKVVGKLI